SAKYVRSVIVTAAQTAAIDAGVVSAPLIQDRLRLSGVVTNVGGKMKFDQESDRLPMAYRVGASFDATKQWKVASDIAFPIDNGPYLALGTEYLWPLGRDWTLAARAGLDTQSMK